MAVDIRHKMKAFAFQCIRSQGLHRHLRPQVRAPNANVNHIGDGGIVTHLFGKLQHGVQGGLNLSQRSLQLKRQALRGRLPQQPVHHLTLLGAIDHGTCEHGIPLSQHACFHGQLLQLCFQRGRPVVLGQVSIHMRRGLAEGGHPCGVLRQLSTHIQRSHGGGLRAQRSPRSCLVQSKKGWHVQPLRLSSRLRA